MEKLKAIRVGVKEVSLAITAGTLTTGIVFLPNIVSPNDDVSVYLKHVGLTICIALGVSLILAQTIVPLLASRIRPSAEPSRNCSPTAAKVYFGHPEVY